MEPARKLYGRTDSSFFYEDVEEAEQKTLGMILWEPEKLEQVRTKLNPNDFRYEKHRLISARNQATEKLNKNLAVERLFAHRARY